MLDCIQWLIYFAESYPLWLKSLLCILYNLYFIYAQTQITSFRFHVKQTKSMMFSVTELWELNFMDSNFKHVRNAHSSRVLNFIKFLPVY